MDSSNVELSQLRTFHLPNHNKSARHVRSDRSMSVTRQGTKARKLTIQNTEGFVNESHQKKCSLQDCEMIEMIATVSILSLILLIVPTSSSDHFDNE